MKKTIALLLSIVMVLSMLPISALGTYTPSAQLLEVDPTITGKTVDPGTGRYQWEYDGIAPTVDFDKTGFPSDKYGTPEVKFYKTSDLNHELTSPDWTPGNYQAKVTFPNKASEDYKVTSDTVLFDIVAREITVTIQPKTVAIEDYSTVTPSMISLTNPADVTYDNLGSFGLQATVVCNKPDSPVAGTTYDDVFDLTDIVVTSGMTAIASSNYNVTVNKGSLTVNAAAGSITTPPSAYDKTDADCPTYSTEERTLVSLLKNDPVPDATGPFLYYVVAPDADPQPTTPPALSEFKAGDSDELKAVYDARDYKVYYAVAADGDYGPVNPAETQKLTLSINKATPTVTPPTLKSGLTYDGTALQLIETAATATPADTVYYAAVKRTDPNVQATAPVSDTDWVDSATSLTQTAAGSYDVFYKTKGNGNLNAVTATAVTTDAAPLVIAKGTPTVTAAPVGCNNATYSATLELLTDAGTVSGGSLQYYQGETKPAADTDWSDAIPKATGAGSFKVWYRIKGDDNYNDNNLTDSDYVTATVAAETIPSGAVTAPVAATLSYTGKPQSLVGTAGIVDAAYGTMKYLVTTTPVTPDASAAGWDDDHTKAVATEAATASGPIYYYLWYKVEGANGYGDIAPTQVSYVQIAPAELAVQPSTVPAREYGDMSDLGATLVVTDQSIPLGAGQTVACTEFTVNATPDTAGNYPVGSHNILVGTVTVTETATGVDKTPNYTINRTPGTLTVNKLQAAFVNGTGPVAAGGAYDNGNDVELLVVDSIAVTGGTFQYAITETTETTIPTTFTDGMPKAANAGTYRVWYMIEADETYDGVAATASSYVDVTITEVAPSGIVDPTAAQNLAYDTTARALANAGDAKSQGEYRYVLGTDATTTPDDTAFTATIPEETNAGTYYVWYKFFGDDNHTDGTAACLTVEIAKATPTVTTAPVGCDNTPFTAGLELLTNAGAVSGGTLYYYVGDTKPAADSTEWSTAVPTAPDFGTFTVWYQIKGDGANYDDNYLTDNDKVTATVAAAAFPDEGIATVPVAATTLSYTGKPQSLVATPGEISTAYATYGTMLYAVTTSAVAPQTTDSIWVESPADAVATDAAIAGDPNNITYFLWYMVKGQNGYGNTEVKKATLPAAGYVTISKATIQVQAESAADRDYGDMSPVSATMTTVSIPVPVSAGQTVKATGFTVDVVKDTAGNYPSGTYNIYPDVQVVDANNKDVTANYIVETLTHGTITIRAIDPTVTAPVAKTGLTFDNTDQVLIDTTNASVTGGSFRYAIVTLSGSETTPTAPAHDAYSLTDVSAVTGKNAGKYYVYYMVKAADGNYNDLYFDTAPIEVTIAKRTAVVTTPPTARIGSFSYDDGVEKRLLENTPAAEAAEASNPGYTGGIQYAVFTQTTDTIPDDAWSTAAPKASNAGTYYVYYRASGDDNYEPSAPALVSDSGITMSPLLIGVTIVDAEKSYGDPDSALKAKIFKGNTSTEDLTGELTADADGFITAEITDPKGTVNVVKFKIARAAGENAGDYTISVSDFTFGVKNGTSIDATPQNLALRNESSTYTGTFKINKATDAYTDPTVPTLKYNSEFQTLLTAGTITTTGTVDETKFLYALGDDTTYPALTDTTAWSETIPTGIKAETYHVWYYLQGDANHNDILDTGDKPFHIAAAIAAADAPTVTAGAYTAKYGDAEPIYEFAIAGLPGVTDPDTQIIYVDPASGQTEYTAYYEHTLTDGTVVREFIKYEATISAADPTAGYNSVVTPKINAYGTDVTLSGETTPTKFTTNFAAPTVVSGTKTIEKRSLVVVPVSGAEKKYGELDASVMPTYAFSATCDGLAAADLAKPELVLSGALSREGANTVAGENIGTYVITQGNLALTADGAKNYTLAFENPDNLALTITPATITITPNNAEKVYGAAEPTISYTAEGFKWNDTVSILTGALSRQGVTSGTDVAEPAVNDPIGQYVITKGTLGLANPTPENYYVVLSDTVAYVTITRKAVTVTANNQSRPYGEANPELTVNIQGVLDGDNFTPAYTVSTTADETTKAGQQITISVNVENAEQGNYTVTGVPGTLTVTKKEVKIQANDNTWVFGETVPPATVKMLDNATGAEITGYTITCNCATDQVSKTIVPLQNNNFAIKNGTQDLTDCFDVKAWLPGTLTIEPKEIVADDVTFSVTSGTAVYNGADQKPAVTVKVTLGTASGTPSVATLVEGQDYDLVWSAATVKDVNTYTATVTGKGNYTGTVDKTFTITKAPLTITTAGAEKAYDGTALTKEDATISGLQGGDANIVTVKGTGTITNVGSVDNTYEIDWDTVIPDNYAIDSVTLGKLTVTKGQATITDLAITGWTYGDTANAPTYTKSSFAADPTITYAGTDNNYSGTTAPTNAGGYTVTVAIAGTDNYEGATASADFTIAKKAVTVSGITAENKTYDGNTTATLVTDNAVFTGVIGDEKLTVTATGAFADANAGVDKTVTISDLTLGGDDVANYVLAADGQQTETTATISKKAVTVSGITAEDKTYDGNTTATLVTDNAVFTGIVTGETLTVTGTGTFESADAAENIKVTISNLTLGGDAAKNYELAADGQQTETTATISKRAVTVSGITAQDKTYDGNTTATLVTDNASFANSVSGDKLTVTGTGAFADANAGKDKTVTISDLTLGGDAVANYELAADGQQTETTATINKEKTELTVKMADYTAGDTPSTPEAIYAGAKRTETFKYKAKDADDSTYTDKAPTTAGTYIVQATISEIDNYLGATATAEFVVKEKSTPGPSPDPAPAPAPSGGGSSGGGSTKAAESYQLDVDEVKNGKAEFYAPTITVTPATVDAGTPIRLEIDPASYYLIDTVTYTTKGSDVAVEIKKDAEGYYSFEMPKGDTMIHVTFKPENANDNSIGRAIIEGFKKNYADCDGSSNCLLLHFEDLRPDAWYHDGIHFCLDNGIMQGFGDSFFQPNALTTRAQVVTVLWNIAGHPIAYSDLSFNDVKYGDWYYDAVMWAAANGIVNGYGDGNFGPNDYITREQIAKILYGYALFYGYDVSATTDISGLPGAEKVSKWAVPYVQWAIAAHVCCSTDGVSEDIAPTEKASRAELATMILNFCINVAVRVAANPESK